MPPASGQAVDDLDSPQLLIDLDVLDSNLDRMRSVLRDRAIVLRVHFKSLKCGGLARYLASRGVRHFLCAKLNEAEVLADAGMRDIFIANQVIGPTKLRRLAELASRADLSVCVDDADNVEQMARAAGERGVTIGVLVEVDIGMHRCGVEPGEPALALARRIHASPGLRFVGLQGYDGHLQLLTDPTERRAKAVEAIGRLLATRRLIERAGIPVAVVTGAGTGTSEWVGAQEGVTEIQPGSFLLMDCAYHAVRPEFGCALSVLATVISRRPLTLPSPHEGGGEGGVGGWYVLDAGSKAISKDFGMPLVKGRAADKVVKLSEEHTRVDTDDPAIRVGSRVEIIPTHCCATMNLHRQCIAVRNSRVEAVWPIEASGRYD
jgi:D-serine deaminase-like pyridoxal phosphate-dependent protein